MFKIESPSSKDALCKVGLKLVQWLTRFLNFAFSLVSLLGKGCDLLLEQTRIPINQECFVSSLVDISPVVLEKNFFFNFVNFFSLLRNYLLLEKDVALLLNKLESLSPEDDLFV